jgi:hypothetical protein
VKDHPCLRNRTVLRIVDHAADDPKQRGIAGCDGVEPHPDCKAENLEPHDECFFEPETHTETGLLAREHWLPCARAERALLYLILKVPSASLSRSAVWQLGTRQPMPLAFPRLSCSWWSLAGCPNRAPSLTVHATAALQSGRVAPLETVFLQAGQRDCDHVGNGA